MLESGENITLEELVEKHPLSIRAWGICMRNDLTTLRRLSYYYEKYRTFKNLRGCGDRVEHEILDLLNSYQRRIEKKSHNIITDIQTAQSSHKLFTPFKKSTLNHHIDYLLSNLSVRALNSLNQQFGNSPSNVLLDNVIETNFDFQDIRNVGEKTVQELNSFRNKVKNFISVLQKLPDSELSKEYTKLILKNTFQLSDSFDQEIHIIFDENGKIRLFALINELISQGAIFNHNEQKIFESVYCINENTNKSLEQIGIELQLTKERVRQLKNNLEEEIENYFIFILNLNTADIYNYEILNSDNLIVIDAKKAISINLNEGVQFTGVFYSIILGILLKNTHSVLGDDEVIHGKGKPKKGRKFRKCYLIEKNIFDIFNFERLLEDIYLKLNEKINENYSIYFEGYLCDFFQLHNLQFILSVKSICEQILFHEFEIVIDSNGFIQFERNTRKQGYEYALEILEESGRMMTVSEVTSAVKLKYPELDVNEASIRSGLQRKKNLFIYIGRSSTYGLKKWEDEQENVKGGTIRDIVEEYLEMENEPKHIAEIMNYVLKYRYTNEKNVITNIKLEDNERFIFYEGGFIGIRSKNYNPEVINFKKAIGTRFTKAFMSKFNNCDFDDVIAFYVSNYGYNPIQIRHLLETKCKEGDIQVINNKMIIK